MGAQLTEFATNHPILVMAFVALLALTLFNEFKMASRKFASLTPAGAVQMINNDEAIMLDVREPGETAAGKISKAIQIPLSSIEQRVSELDKHKAAPVIVYCKNGTRSSMACKTLNKNGFEKVFNLNGGITAWLDANLPTSKK